MYIKWPIYTIYRVIKRILRNFLIYVRSLLSSGDGIFWAKCAWIHQHPFMPSPGDIRFGKTRTKSKDGPGSDCSVCSTSCGPNSSFTVQAGMVRTCLSSSWLQLLRSHGSIINGRAILPWLTSGINVNFLNFPSLFIVYAIRNMAMHFNTL